MTENTHDYQCPDCGFTSVGWPTENAAAARGTTHQLEHETGETTRDLTTAEES